MAIAIMMVGALALTPKTASAGTSYMVNAIVELGIYDRMGFRRILTRTRSDFNGEFFFNVPTIQEYFVAVRDPSNGSLVVETLHTPDSLTIHGRITSTDSGATWFIDFDPAPLPEEEDGELQNDAQTEKAKALAGASGSSVNDIIAMRESGMGWGEIAKELGLDPSIVGNGKKGKGKK